MAHSMQSLYKNIVLRLNALYNDEEARAMADRLFEQYIHLSPAQRVLSGILLVDDDKTVLIEEAVIKLLHDIPLQYVLGKAFFMDMELTVNPSVLIPRPETEELVSLILKHQKGRQTNHEMNILDIGTGSGCIPIALKRQLRESNVSAIDISEEALKVASENAVKNNVAVNFILADILDQSQWESLPLYDLIVSNPPYVTHGEKKMMMPNVLDHEPHTALFVPDDDPLVFYRSIMMFAKEKLIAGGTLWLEINEAFGPDVVYLFEIDMFKECELLKDMFGKFRFVKVTK